MVKKVSKLQKKSVQAGQFNFAELLGDINYLDSEQKDRKTSSVQSEEKVYQTNNENLLQTAQISAPNQRTSREIVDF